LHPVNKPGGFGPCFLPTQPLNRDRNARKFISPFYGSTRAGSIPDGCSKDAESLKSPSNV
jgi:hypothetical protein